MDASGQVTVKGLDKVNEDKIGIYPISYSVANSDGYLSTAKQTVYVVDLNADTDISGDYKIDVRSSSGQKGSEQPVPFSSAYPLTIKKVATSIFTISDLFGGWFNLQQGWGGDFAFSADCFLTEAVTDNNTVRINPLADKLVMANQDEDEKEITVQTATEEDQRLLDLRGYDMVAVVKSYTYLEGRKLFQYTESRHRPDKFKFVDFARR